TVANDTLAETKPESDVDKLLTGVSSDSLSNDSTQELGPIFSLMQGQGFQGSPIIGFFATKDTAQVNTYLKDPQVRALLRGDLDRKSTRLNSSHVKISYAVFCLKKKK